LADAARTYVLSPSRFEPAPAQPHPQPSAASRALGAIASLLLFGSGDGCPVGWEGRYSSHAPNELHCYKYLGTSMNYADAVATCTTERDGAYPVTIGGHDENALVYNATGPVENRIWLGLTDTTVEGTFEWIDGSDVVYTNWLADEPNDDFGNGEDSGELGPEGKWNDDGCATPRQAMCEFSTLLLSDICPGAFDWYVAPGPRHFSLPGPPGTWAGRRAGPLAGPACVHSVFGRVVRSMQLRPPPSEACLTRAPCPLHTAYLFCSANLADPTLLARAPHCRFLGTERLGRATEIHVVRPVRAHAARGQGL
jgi:hypothetical protein